MNGRLYAVCRRVGGSWHWLSLEGVYEYPIWFTDNTQAGHFGGGKAAQLASYFSYCDAKVVELK